NSVSQKVLGVPGVDFILSCTGEGTLRFPIPKRIVIKLRIDRSVNSALELLGIFGNSATPYVFKLNYKIELLRRNSFLIVDKAAGIGRRDRLCTKTIQLLDRILRDVAAPGHEPNLVFKIFLAGLQHCRREINRAITRGFRPNDRATPGESLSR